MTIPPFVDRDENILAILERKVKSFDIITDTNNLKWKEGVILTPKDGVVISAC